MESLAISHEPGTKATADQDGDAGYVAAAPEPELDQPHLLGHNESMRPAGYSEARDVGMGTLESRQMKLQN